MYKDHIKTEIIVKEQKVNVMRVDNKEYISLADLVIYADKDDLKYHLQNWIIIYKNN